MIQDIAPHVFLNQYQPKPPEAQSYILYYEGNPHFCSYFSK
ncbi:MAG: hypothetical protein RR869_08345 [Lachnospiraceae bacterium]